MARSRGSFRSRATSLANNTRRAERLRADKRQARHDDSVSISISLDRGMLVQTSAAEPLQPPPQMPAEVDAIDTLEGSSDCTADTHRIDNPLLTVDTSEQVLPFEACLPAPRGESPENDLMQQSVEADPSIVFGDFITDNSSSSSSSSSSTVLFEPAPTSDEQFAKLWDEESQTWSEYSQNGASRDDGRPSTGDSIESSASALHRCQEQQRQQALAYQAAAQQQQQQQQQQMFAFQQQHAYAIQLHQTHQAQLMHACYYEEQNLVTTPRPKRATGKHKMRRKQQRESQENESRARKQTQYNPQHQERRRQEARRRKQALQYLNQAESRRDEGFLQPPLPQPFNLGVPNLIPPPPLIPMMGAPMLNFMPQMMTPVYPNDLAGYGR
jgi:hypothetical protein